MGPTMVINRFRIDSVVQRFQKNDDGESMIEAEKRRPRVTETVSSEHPDAHRDGSPPESQPKIGIALGAGGAKGIAHIPMLEALDELGVTPHRIAGCSIGAVMGALYASGLSATEIKDKIARLAITRSDTVRNVFSENKISKLSDFRTLHFYKVDKIYQEAQPAKEELKRELSEKLSALKAPTKDQGQS